MASDKEIRPLLPAQDEDTIKARKEWLSDAERGDLVGVVLLGAKPGNAIQHHWVGRMPAGSALAAFEWWKKEAFREG
jgi:hypothetical protein